jgi:hypothetical protein
MNTAWRKHKGHEKHINNYVGNSKRSDHLQGIGIDGKIAS